jgi:DNA ligase 1
VQFADLVAVYAKIEATRKRLETRTLLADLFRAVPRAELPEVLYLSQGLLAPEYDGIELGVADSLARRAVSLALGIPEEEVAAHLRASGDLGTTAEELGNGRLPTQTPPLEVSELFQGLRAIASASGDGSQETKIQLLAGLLARCSALEARYVSRFVLGRLRLGVREMTILDALAERWAGGTKYGRDRIEAAFNLCSDLALVAAALADGGLDGLASIHLEVGRPVRPMLAERVKDLAEMLKRMEGQVALEYKYDGLRVQGHVPREGPARLFSRRLEDITDQFPELAIALPKAITARPAIVEGECVPIDPETGEIRPFQDVSRRRGRKYDLDRIQSEIPVCLFLFDVLMGPDGPVIDEPLPRRRGRLQGMLAPSERVQLAEQLTVTDVEAAQTFFDAAIAAGGEGVMGKSVSEESRYRAGARGFWWIKYKREYTIGLADSIDGVVIGGFAGRGRRAGRWGALLMAAYDPGQDRFESFCKVGSGFDDATLAKLPELLLPLEVDERPAGVVTGLVPDRWFRPGVVLEVRGAELSLSPIHHAGMGRVRAGVGFALRFPRFTGRFRPDKKPTDATTVDELLRLYRTQVKQSAPDPPAEDPAA